MSSSAPLLQKKNRINSHAGINIQLEIFGIQYHLIIVLRIPNTKYHSREASLGIHYPLISGVYLHF